METKSKPVVMGRVNGNIFAVMAAAMRVLKAVGMRAEATEMKSRMIKSMSYSEALSIAMEYVDFDIQP